MKRKHGLSLLFLVALGLAACGQETGNASTTEETTSISENVTDATDETSDQLTDSEPVSVDPITSDVSSPDISTDTGGSDSSSESSTDDPTTDPIDTSQEHYREMWGDTVSDSMVKYLDYIIPFIDIGKPSAIYNKGDDDNLYLQVEGTKTLSDWTADEWKSEFAKYFKADGFEVNTEASLSLGLVATSTALGLTVTLIADEDASTLKCVYDEPFDSTSQTDWTDEVKESFRTYINDTDTIPYVYLGTKNPYVDSYSNSFYTYRIFGKKWDDRMEALARTSFQNDNGWTITDFTSGTSVFKAEKSLDDGSKLAVTLDKLSSDITKQRALLKVKVTKTYDLEDAEGKYSDDILATAKTIFGVDEVPYIYLGTNTPNNKAVTSSGSVSSTALASRYIQLQGGDWDDRCFESIYDQLTTNAPGFTWTEDHTSGTTTGIYQGSDSVGNKWYITIISVASKINAYFSYAPQYQSSSEHVWSQEIKDYFTNYLDGHELPYFNLGYNPYVELPEEEASLYGVEELSGIWSLYEFSDAAMEDFITAFKNDTSATWDIDTFNYRYSKEVTASTTYSDGSSITVIFAKSDAGTTTTTKRSNPFDRLMLEIDYVPSAENLDKTSRKTSWTTKAQTNMKNALGGHILPFVWLNVEGDATSSFTTSNGYLRVTGGEYASEVYKDFLNVYKTDEWTVVSDESSASSPSLKLTKTFDDGNQIVVELLVASTGNMEIHAYIGYESMKTSGTWHATDKSNMTTYLKETLPYFNMGSVKTTAKISTYTADSNRLQFKGGYYDSKALDLAEATLKADTNEDGTEKWTITRKTISVTETLQAIKTNSDGSELKLIFFKSGKLLYLDAYYEAAPTYPDTTSSWSSDVTDAMKENLNGNVIPYLYLGDDQTFTATGVLNGVSITYNGKATDTNNQYLKKVAETLTADGYAATYSPFVDYSTSLYFSSMVEAEKTLDDGSKLHIRVSKSSSSKGAIIITYTPKYNAPSDEESKAWSEDIQTKMTTNLNGNVLPYVYLGEDQKALGSSDFSSNKFTVTGYAWHDEYMDAVKDAYSKDTTRNWNIGMDYSLNSSNGGKLIMSCEDPNNAGHYITVMFYKGMNSNYLLGYPVMEFYYI